MGGHGGGVLEGTAHRAGLALLKVLGEGARRLIEPLFMGDHRCDLRVTGCGFRFAERLGSSFHLFNEAERILGGAHPGFHPLQGSLDPFESVNLRGHRLQCFFPHRNSLW